MNVIVIGLSHHSSPVELRERFAFADAKIPDALKSLRESGIAGEAVILSTCNRVEIYAATSLEPAKAFEELGWAVAAREKRLNLYPWPASECFDRSLHFAARLERR